MSKSKLPFASKRSRESKSEELFSRADKMRDRGNLRSAFRLFLAAANAGDTRSQLNVGHCYDTGSGTRRNRSAAVYWYKRAYRRGDANAANNIGTIWRDEKKPHRALSWFQRAVKMGNDDSNLEIAKHYLRNEHDPRKAMPYLKKVFQSDRVTEASAEEARRLMKRIEKQLAKADANRQ
jgi:TPR repeat protein